MDDAEPAPPAAATPDEEKPVDEQPVDDEMPSDAEMEAEMAAEEAEAAAILTKAPAKGMGAVVGVVTDAKFNESIIEAPVTVIGTERKTFTDIEGRYRLELPPGQYTIRVYYELHRPARVDQVVVRAGEVTRVDTSLTPDESAVETVEIVSNVDKSSLEGQTLERRRSAAVGDGVGRAEIARTPDRNAAEAARRVVGASIVGGRFVYVRGLGERYTNAALNGSPLPSPEPDRNTVPLDLFPALIVDSLTINKTFTPDQPADFAGGSVRIFTRQFPRETLAQLSLNLGYNTNTTFRQGLGYRGSSTDWLGYDGGIRSLHPDVPDEKVEGGVAERVGPKLNSRMSTTRRTMPPNFGGSLVLGDAWKVGTDQKLGAILALSYGRSYQITRDEKVRTYRLPGSKEPDLVARANYRAERGSDTVRWGGFASINYELSPRHRLSVSGLHSQSADDSATEMEGPTDQTGGTPVHLTRLSYASRALDFVQLKGEHELPILANAQLAWFGALSYATRDEPDTRANFYLWRPDLPTPAWTWQANAQSGSHLFAEQSEVQRSGGLDWTQPLGLTDRAPRAKLGGLISVRDREFDARRFELARAPGRLNPEQLALFNCEGRAFRADCSDKLFDSTNVGTVLRVSEKTRENDAYDASLSVYAGYLMLDAEVLKGLRAVGGARIEVTKQSIDSFDPFATTEKPISGSIDETDVLPALSLTHAVGSKANTRFAISRTLARPQLRELAPFVFNPYFGGYPTQGNPDLKLTYITNADLRFELFPTMREVLAFSFFYKHFQDPIEELLRSRGDSSYVTYANAQSADLLGIELEARKNLDSVSPALKDFSVLANLTLVKSRVQLSEVGISTNASRPLSQQAPYIINLALDYSLQGTKTQARVLYNVNGPRIVTVGSDGLQDIYEKPRHLVDLTVVQGLGKHFELKANVQNLLSSPLRTTQRGVDPDGAGEKRGTEHTTTLQRQGTTFTLAASYTY